MMCSIISDVTECRCGKSSYKAISHLCPDLDTSVRYKSCYVVGGKSRIRLLLRYMISALQNILYLCTTPKDRIIVYPFNNLFGLYLLNACNKITRKKIVVFCHGEMEGVVSDTFKAGLLSKILISLGRRFFLNKNIKISEGLYFSVMGKAIKDNLSKIIDQDKIDHFICVDHPYIFLKEITPVMQNKVIEIGTAGAINEIKGLNLLVKLWQGIPVTLKDKVNFSITGVIFGDREYLAGIGIDIPAKKGTLPRSEYDERISKLDYLLFLYPTDSYRVTASGAIMDAIAYQKPILSLRNDYFQYLFDTFGEFGYLFDNMEQMKQKIETIVQNNERLEIDFNSFQQKFTPQLLSQSLKDELIRVEVLV